ncbi:MAG: L,D-transpeptidase, partial [Bdellovibrionota bacterium]
TPGCPGAPCFFASRFSRLPVLSKEKSGDYRVPGGIAPRKAVRIAYARPRPRGVGPEEKWVHVDLTEQVLTAYEGDTLVFATLVSTGKKETQTKTGLFRVWRKAIHEALQGEPEDPYLVEEVPFLLFFHEEQAFHGTFWHEAFGTAASHGCVNLSMADAAWLFEWAPPRLPPGWHSITPEPAGLPTLWVQVERAAPGVVPPRKISSSEISFP